MTRSLMIQGTGSGVGKSVLCAAFCRIFYQDGLRVAPFKSQNMSLNSFVTRDGLEMARSQVVQAEAAGIEPSVDMNPILLKPGSDIGCQVILQGKVVGNYSAEAYGSYVHEAWTAVCDSYERLARQYSVVVLEGAGSPAEVNLKDRDIVNMRTAEMAHAPVLLAADIDKGGVFASLIGTLELLELHERERIKGFLINKFRGDVTLLAPGLDFIEKRTFLLEKKSNITEISLLTSSFNAGFIHPETRVWSNQDTVPFLVNDDYLYQLLFEKLHLFKSI